MFLFKTIVCVFLIVFASPLYGRRVLEIPYVQFEIGENWKCRSFGPHWVCHHRFSDAAKPAIIMVTGHLRQGEDTESVYSQMFGYKQLSKSAPIVINRHTWFEAFDNQGGFGGLSVSRHVGTVCCEGIEQKVHILIGFYASQKNYQRYSAQFLSSIQSLKLPAHLKRTFLNLRAQTPEERREMMAYMVNLLFDDELDIDDESYPKQKSGLWIKYILGGLLLLFVVPLFMIYYKKRKRKKRRRSSRSKKKSYRKR